MGHFLELSKNCQNIKSALSDSFVFINYDSYKGQNREKVVKIKTYFKFQMHCCNVFLKFCNWIVNNGYWGYSLQRTKQGLAVPLWTQLWPGLRKSVAPHLSSTLSGSKMRHSYLLKVLNPILQALLSHPAVILIHPSLDLPCLRKFFFHFSEKNSSTVSIIFPMDESTPSLGVTDEIWDILKCTERKSMDRVENLSLVIRDPVSVCFRLWVVFMHNSTAPNSHFCYFHNCQIVPVIRNKNCCF